MILTETIKKNLVKHLNYNNSNDYENSHNSKYLNYLVEIINSIRQDPALYSQLIENSI